MCYNSANSNELSCKKSVVMCFHFVQQVDIVVCSNAECLVLKEHTADNSQDKEGNNGGSPC